MLPPAPEAASPIKVAAAVLRLMVYNTPPGLNVFEVIP